MSTAISTLTKYVSLEAPGCLHVIIEREILWAARRFCDRTKIWHEDKDTTYAAGGLGDVDLATPADSEIVSIDSVLADNYDIPSATEYELSAINANWRTEEGPAERFISYPHKNSILLYRKPTAPTQIDYTVTLKPTLDATTLPDFLVDKYRDALVDGAKYRVLGQAAMTWNNPKRSEECRREFERMIQEATDKVYRGISTVQYDLMQTLV